MKTLASAPYLIVFTLAACSHPTQPVEPLLDTSVDGKSIDVLLNQNFSVELEVCADAGFQWVPQIGDTRIVTIDRQPTFRPKSGNLNQTGGMSMETMHFRSMASGKCTIRMFDLRPWEKDVAPVDTVQFSVRVRP